ncbi:MAG: 16S rRNA (cytosine(967)-C(5))-methyltransferase [Candidatus Marinimicrobia bacterium]|nr:16S rRNA (cytosine(967)-C(5))-methyltransferase [Candidatus Neomarinimicrobiota bacterium]|tara:strand:+ start:11987 stop:13303 length:1317 start_codon:yes stop_codon:yes gene_type:complete
MNNLQKNNINNDGAYTRKKAIEILVKILENNKPLDNAFEESTKKSSHFSKLINEDKSFCRLLISTTLRNLISIDYLLTKFLSKPLNKTPLKVLMILRINVAQSFFLKTPDHAVVNTAVELCGKKWKGLVNGVSREILRNKDKAKKYLNESDKVPNWLLRRWKRDWGKNYDEIVTGHLNLNPPIDLYVKNNTNYWARKLNGKKLGNNSIRLFTPGLISNLEGYEQGEWWIQDYSSQIPVSLLEIQNNDDVLDLCAAPGGKTAQLISLGAKVTSIDNNKKRLFRLEQNLKRLEYKAIIKNKDIRNFSTKKTWSKIILDAPCSSTGTLRKNPEIMHQKKESDIVSLSKLQSDLLDTAWDLLKEGGTLLYCTCSLEKEEGEHQVENFIKRKKNSLLDKINNNEIDKKLNVSGQNKWLRIFPNSLNYEGGNDGFFIARIKKIT